MAAQPQDRWMADKKAIVIFGATGDLAQKMLYPSLYFLDAEGHLPEACLSADFRTPS